MSLRNKLFPEPKAPKVPSKQYVFTMSGDHLSESKVSRLTADTISHFARRPVLWGDEILNQNYMLNTPLV
jgi:hypothetical protein